MQILSFFFISFSIFLTQSCGVQKTSPAEVSTASVEQDDKTEEATKVTFPLAEYTTKNKLEAYEQAIFAGGCFWCTEAVFERIDGVIDVISGYSGGHKAYPSYYEVGRETTGHAEAICIYYDPKVIDYATLLDVFFVAHDPTTLNRQGPDVGEAYRSAIYFQSDNEKMVIDQKIKTLNASDHFKSKIVTEVAAYEEFWVAEDYHQNYYELNPNHGYVVRVSRPKVHKVIKTFPDLIKLDYRKR